MNYYICDAIEKLGGTRSAANHFGIKRQAVNEWRHREAIPLNRVLEVARKTNINPILLIDRELATVIEEILKFNTSF